MTETTILAYAKLNLYLDITGKRADGYHELTGIMHTIDLSDTLHVRITDKMGISIVCDNPDVPADEGNIAYKAAELFFSELTASGIAALPAVEIDIQKRIPVMAGMGGSSTDGAAVLRALNRLHNNVFSEAQLMKMGGVLGADVPFCLTGGTALISGIGDVLIPITPLEDVYFVIIKPTYANSTAEMFEKYDAQQLNRTDVEIDASRFESLIKSITEKKFYENASLMYNVFQEKEADKIYRELIDVGAKAAIMTGSGSAVFGVFKTFREALTAYGKLDYPFKYIACNVI